LDRVNPPRLAHASPNGVTICNLSSSETLVSLIVGVCRQDPERWRQFDAIYAETLVFRRKAMLEATEPLMSENGIPRRGSDDVLAVWNGKVAKN
jgi:hypothetical protein